MKKVFLAVAVVALMVLGASCSKEKTCVCTYDGTAFGVAVSISMGERVIEGSCSELEEEGQWASFNFGQVANGAIHCSKK